MRVETVTYVGDDNNPRSFTGIGFQPKLVFVMQNEVGIGGSFLDWKIADHPAGDCSRINGSAGGLDSSYIDVILSDGFRVQSQLNLNGIHYSAYCFADDSDCLAVGSYSGNGGGVRNITIGFQPDWVHVNHDDTGELPRHWCNPPGGDLSYEPSGYGGNLWTAGKITGAFSTGFSVGSAFNVSGRSYYYFAFKTKPSNVLISSYDGNDLGGYRNIVPSDPFQPAFIFEMAKQIAGSSGTAGHYKFVNIGTLDAIYCYNGTPYANRIRSFNADGFTIGDGDLYINTSGYRYFYLIFKNDLTVPIANFVSPHQARKLVKLDGIAPHQARRSLNADQTIPIEAIWSGTIWASVAIPYQARAIVNLDQAIPHAAQKLVHYVTADIAVPHQARFGFVADAVIPHQARRPEAWMKEASQTDLWVKETPIADAWSKEAGGVDGWSKS